MRSAFVVPATTLACTMACVACSSLQQDLGLSDHLPVSVVELNTYPDAFEGRAINIVGHLKKTVVLSDYSGRDSSRLHYGSLSADEACQEDHTPSQCAPITLRLADPLDCSDHVECGEGAILLGASGIVSLDCLRSFGPPSKQTPRVEPPGSATPDIDFRFIECPWGSSIVLRDAILNPIREAKVAEAVSPGDAP